MSLPDFFGLDFGNHSIKIVHLKEQNKTPRLLTYGNIATPDGVIKSENKQHQQQLAEAAKNLVKSLRLKTKKCVVALPESSIFTRLVTMPQMNDEELENAVYWEAKQYVPVDLSEVQLDWMDVGEMKTGELTQKKVLIIAAPKTLVQLYVTVVKMAGLEPIALETEAIANVRSIGNSTKKANSIILDFGAQTTDLTVTSGGNLLFSQTLSTGSDALTKSIMEDYSFTREQAEQYKRTYGIDETQLEGRLAETLKPVMNMIVEEVRRAISFYRNHSVEDAPNKVLMVGDGAKLPGMVAYMTKSLGVESVIGNPWNNIRLNERFSRELAPGAPGYSVVVGLALKTR